MNTPHLPARSRLVSAACACCAALLCSLAPFQSAHAQGLTQIHIPGPAGSGAFGTGVTVLPNGNFVVTDPGYDDGPAADVGAVYLYHGATLEIISTLKGSMGSDRVGQDGVTVLANGNFVVRSPRWNDNHGAVSWGSADTGFGAPQVVVSATNSLVGSEPGDRVGSDWVLVLTNGNYVVRSINWKERGAVAWANGQGGTVGVLSAENSLVGSTRFDQVGSFVVALDNGNYVVGSPSWDKGAESDAGAATWGSGTMGVRGEISASNSLVGDKWNDRVGWVFALANGNYAVASRDWNGRRGAVTWGDGAVGSVGVVTAANSLVGGTTGDEVGSAVAPLPNGDYVVSSPYWDNGVAVDAGAVTWADGAGDTVDLVSAANSLVGGAADDSVGSSGVWVVGGGNYVVGSRFWDNGAAMNAGAVTWASGAGATVGLVSPANSLVGVTAGELEGVFFGVTVLANGNYVVSSPAWGDYRGAATWGSGAGGVSGAISAANSLVGSERWDRVGEHVTGLANGNYVVGSPYWASGAATWGSGATGIRGLVSTGNSLVGGPGFGFVGRSVTALANGNYVVGSPQSATWCNGAVGAVGEVSAANSLVGSADSPYIADSVTALANGNYVVSSPTWNNRAALEAGAVTWGNGTTGLVGAVSAANSLVGSQTNDWVGGLTYGDVGLPGVTALADGNYVVSSYHWDNGAVRNAGTVTLRKGNMVTAGPISAFNSVLGATAEGGLSQQSVFNAVHQTLIVGRPADNAVTVAYLTGDTMILSLVIRLEE